MNKNTKIEGRYANYFKVGYNAFEFLIDFSQIYSENEEVQLHSRIVTNPIYAKALLHTLSKSIAQYEKIYGCIEKENGQEKSVNND